MTKNYVCPVCGRVWSSIAKLKSCVDNHDTQSKAQEAEEKKKREKELEAKITTMTENLKKLIEEFNKESETKTYTIRVSAFTRRGPATKEPDTFDEMVRGLLKDILP